MKSCAMHSLLQPVQFHQAARFPTGTFYHQTEHPKKVSHFKKLLFYGSHSARKRQKQNIKSYFNADYSGTKNKNQISRFVNEPKPEINSAALAIAAAIGAASSTAVEVKKKDKFEEKETFSSLFSHTSEEFIALCENQLELCSQTLVQEDRITVYIRTPDSYSTGILEFRLIAIYPSPSCSSPSSSSSSSFDDSMAEEVISLSFSESSSFHPHHLLEKYVSSNEVFELPDRNALIFSLTKDSFVMGLVVIERLSHNANFQKTKMNNAYEDSYPSSSSSSSPPTSPSPSLFSEIEQEAILKFIQSIKLACVIDQRALLLQQSSIQNNIHINNFIEKMHDPLTAFRTLGRILKPQLQKGELSHDIVEDMIIQGDKMKENLQKIKQTIPKPNLQNFKKSKFIKSKPESPRQVPKKFSNQEQNLSSEKKNLDQESNFGSEKKNLARKSIFNCEKNYLASESNFGREKKKSSKFFLPSEKKNFDRELSMPPLALPPINSNHEYSPCDVVPIIENLVNAGQPLAEERSIDVQLSIVDPNTIPMIHAESSQIKNIFSILIGLSLNSSPPDGWIRLELMKAPGGGVLIILEDNGPGINHIQPIMMEPLNAYEMNGGNSSNDYLMDEISNARELLEDIGGVLRASSLGTDMVRFGGKRIEVWLPPIINQNDNDLPYVINV